jgi:hypothetical protein
MRVVIAPNEDGLGTASWAVRLGRALAAIPGVAVKVAAIKPSTVGFLALALEGSAAEVTALEGVTGWIEMAKSRGALAVEPTRERLDHYETYRETYWRAVRPLLRDADLVVELGVPPMARAGQDATRVVTVFDHAWSETLRRSAGEHRAIKVIAADERRTSAVYLFSEPVAPGVFAEYWRGAGVRVEVIDGVFGGGNPAARVIARRALGIPRTADVVFVSGAGTPVWDGMLRRLVEEYRSNPLETYCVLYSPVEAARLGVRMQWTHSTAGWSAAHRGVGRLIFVGAVRGETHQALLSGADLVISRAGGGTVNDAIATRVPVLLVEEPGHWQVEAIRQSAVAMGLARSVPLDHLRRAPARCVAFAGRLDRERHRMESIAAGAENRLASALVTQYGA